MRNSLWAAQVPCRWAIRTVQAVVEEVPEAKHASVGALAKLSEKNSERDMHRVASQFGLTLPIPLSPLKLATGCIQWLKMSAWAAYLLHHNMWHLLCGLDAPDHHKCSEIWTCWWERYRQVDPNHDVFKKGIDLSTTAAVLLHGDGGRSLRKSEIMVISVHSALGFGLQTSNFPSTSDMKLNYGRITWTTRYLLAVLPKFYYSKDDGKKIHVFQDLMLEISRDLASLMDGITDREGRRFHFAVIRVKGDWPFIQKCGLLNRTFMNAAKHQTARKAPKGICHRCCADQPGVPWEDFRHVQRPWKASVNTMDPFDGVPAVLMLGHNREDAPSFFSWDLFHTWHVGLGKVFLGSAIVVLAMGAAFEGAIPERLEKVSNHYLAWCSDQKIRPMVKGFPKDKLSWPQTNTFPSAVWAKGSTTTQVMRWFVHECRAHRRVLVEDRLFLTVAEAAKAIHRFLSGLYRHNVWIPDWEARRLASQGRRFLQLYGEAVRLSFQAGRALFSLVPNLHRLDHIVHDLEEESQTLPLCLSPLIFSTQMDEDFVGRSARISRRVSARKCILRTIQRCLESAYDEYVRQGILILDA